LSKLRNVRSWLFSDYFPVTAKGRLSAANQTSLLMRARHCHDVMPAPESPDVPATHANSGAGCGTHHVLGMILGRARQRQQTFEISVYVNVS